MPSYTRNLPHLTPEEISKRDLEESRLNSALNRCWRGDSFDHERASHVLPGFADEMFDVVYAAYRKKTGYKAEWVSDIINEIIYRIFVVYDGFNTYGKPSLQELSKALGKSLLYHFHNDPKYAPLVLLPPSRYANAGIDVASASPLLTKLHSAAQARGANAFAPIPAEPKRRIPRSIHSEPAARRMEAYIQAKGMTQTAFAAAVKADERTLRRFRTSGKVDKSVAQRIASAMGITLDHFLS